MLICQEKIKLNFIIFKIRLLGQVVFYRSPIDPQPTVRAGLHDGLWPGRTPIPVAKGGSCKTGFSVILNEVKDLNLLKIRDSSLRSE
jgi:hypothetical protein